MNTLIKFKDYSIEASVYLNESKEKFVARVNFKIFFGAFMIVLNKCGIYKNNDGSLFLTFPSQPYNDKITGKIKYSDYFGANKFLKSILNDEAIEIYDKMIKKLETKIAGQMLDDNPVIDLGETIEKRKEEKRKIKEPDNSWIMEE